MAGRMSLHCHRNKLQVGVETTLLLLLSYVTGSACNKVVVPEHVNAVLGKNITLGCKVEVEANLSLTQISWERKLASGTTTLAVFNPQFGISIPQEYAWRLSFRSPSTHDGTIVLGDVGFADAGVYVCKVATFPLGNTQSSTVVTVIVEPKVYVSAGSEVLLDGGNETSVATCTAERAQPPAEVSWESPLYGHSEVLQRDELDGTTTTTVHYTWRPTRHAQDRALTCVVRHPALPTEFRILYRLNVQFAPDVTVAPSDGDWFVGRQRFRIQCRASANPPVLRYRWSRLGRTLPEGVEVANGTLLFMRPLELNDSGIYSCEVENDVGVRSQEALVRVREPPSTPALTSYPTATPSGKQRAQLSSPTQASPPDSHLGSIVGGVVGGVLFLVLLLVLGVACYTRRRRTFRGDYYTKQYLGPADMQRESQLDVLQPHELQEVYGGRADPRPRSDCTSEQKDREEWGGSVDGGRRIHKEEAYHLNHLSPRGTYSNNNGVPYVPEERYDNSTDSDYVSHLDGSVISRREWYV